jgi:hypothetical protein
VEWKEEILFQSILKIGLSIGFLATIFLRRWQNIDDFSNFFLAGKNKKSRKILNISDISKKLF